MKAKRTSKTKGITSIKIGKKDLSDSLSAETHWKKKGVCLTQKSSINKLINKWPKKLVMIKSSICKIIFFFLWLEYELVFSSELRDLHSKPSLRNQASRELMFKEHNVKEITTLNKAIICRKFKWEQLIEQ